jgi:N-acetylmuramoyl-L-alanine amidase
MTAAPTPDSPIASAFLPSPNFGERRGPLRPDSVILHYTGMPTAKGALALLRDRASEVSAHYFVWESGEVAQLVREEKRAWHAGVGSWAGQTDLNSASIGIEIVNPGHDGGLPPFPRRQIDAVVGLCRDIASRWAIRPERILAHSDVAPARKRDPGEKFPWDVLARAGVGHWTPPAPIVGGALFGAGQEGPPIRALQAMLALYGYGVEITGVYDRQTKTVVTAFQRHFRPERVDGEADASTIGALRALVDALNPRETARS